MNKKITGDTGEKIACKYLEKLGYTIHETNWTSHWGEIDIIAKSKNTLVFVEVKYRKTDYLGRGYESFNYYKKRALMRAINKYMLQNGLKNIPLRLDVINILGKKLYHYKAVTSEDSGALTKSS